MKTLLFALILSLSTFVAKSQDTAFTYYDRATSFTLEAAPHAGYVVGTGWVDFMGVKSLSEETAMHFTNTANLDIEEVLIWFGRVGLISTGDSVTAKVYTAKPDKNPDTEVGYGKLSLDDATFSKTAATYTAIPINKGGNGLVSGDFLVALNYNNINDTVGIMTNSKANSDGNGEMRLRQFKTGANWNALDGFAGQSFNADAMLIPVYSVLNSSFESNSDEDLRFNNRVCDEIRFTKTASDISAYQIIDSMGKVVRSRNVFSETIDVAEFSTGFYYLITEKKNGEKTGYKFLKE